VSSGIAITGSNFDEEVINSPVPVLIDFWASWCGPCKMIAPFLDQIADEYSGRLKVCKVNVDEETTLAERHGIVSIPTLVLYKGGSPVVQKAGAVPKNDIESMFKGFI